MKESVDRENNFVDMLKQVTEKSPRGVIVSKDLFEMIKEESLIYSLGHFYISVKNVLPPFCPFYLHLNFADKAYVMCDTEEDCDKMLLELNYKIRGIK